jgi:hypothetical protein
VARDSLRAAATPVVTDVRYDDNPSRLEASATSDVSTESSRVSAYIRGAPGTVVEMQLDVLGIRNFYLRVHVTIERPSRADVPFSVASSRNRPLVHLTVERNQDLQSEAELHSKSGISCEASLKTYGTQQVSCAGPRP